MHLLYRPSFPQELGAICTLQPCQLGQAKAGGRGEQDVSPRGGRSAEPVLTLSGYRGVILHLCRPAVGAGHKQTSRREEDFRSAAGEAWSDQGEEKQALSVTVIEPLNTTYKQVRRALGRGGHNAGGRRGH